MTKNAPAFRLAMLAATTLATAYAVPVLAQSNTQNTSSDVTLDEIIVTAQRRSETVREVPMSISALTGDALENLGITKTEDLAKIIPSFSFAQSFTNAPIYTLRGVGLNETTLAAGPTVSVYVDEVPLPFSVMTRGASLDLARMEVLKGPQGTLYGQNATGGAINYIAVKPTDDTQAGGAISFSRFNTLDAKAYVNGALTDTLSARISVQTTQADDWQKNQAGDSLGRTDFLQGRLLLNWTPADTVRLLLNVNGWRDRSDAQAPQLVAKFLQFPANAGPGLLAAQPNVGQGNRIAEWDPGVDYANDDNFKQVALRGEIDLNDDITLTSISAFNSYRQDETRDIDGTSSQVLLLGSGGKIDSLSQEIRLVGDANALQWIVGGNYAHDKADETQTFDISQQTNNLIFGIPNVQAALKSRQEVDTIAAFANADYALTDDLTLQAGARYTDSRRDFTSCSLDSGNGYLAQIMGTVQTVAKSAFGLPAGPVPVRGGCVVLDQQYNAGLYKDELNERNLSWRTGLKYDVNENVMIYGNVSRGYKSGMFPTVLATAAAQYAPVKQEKLTAYETGLKLSAWDRRADLSMAAFYYDYRDKQVRSRILDPIFVVLESVANVPKSDVKGLEAPVALRPVDGLTLNLAGSYTDATIKRFVGINQLAQPEDFGGTTMPFTSKWQGVGDVEYRWPVTGNKEAFLGGAISYASSSNAFLGNDPVGLMKSRTLVDLRAGIGSDDGTWQVSLWGRNVTDKHYLNYVVRVTDTVIGYAGRPATYGATLTVNFQ